jgi:hypothetical protein
VPIDREPFGRELRVERLGRVEAAPTAYLIYFLR